MQTDITHTVWTYAEVTSSHLTAPVSVVVGRDIPYTENNNKRQTFTIHLPDTSENAKIIGKEVQQLPRHKVLSKTPTGLVHIHGGARRDPFLTSASIGAAVSHAFSEPDKPLDAIVSLNYTLSPFPTHPIVPYDPERDNYSDPSRDARHPDHVSDILLAFSHLRKLGLVDGSYILRGRSAGACLFLQTTLAAPKHYGLERLEAPPVPAAVLGLNGLYDLQNLVHGLGPSHEHLGSVYENLISVALNPIKASGPQQVQHDLTSES